MINQEKKLSSKIMQLEVFQKVCLITSNSLIKFNSYLDNEKIHLIIKDEGENFIGSKIINTFENFSSNK